MRKQKRPSTSPAKGKALKPKPQLVDGRFCFRIYAGNAAEATLRIPQLWQGKHPMAKMHTWLLSRCRAEFDRPVPFQIGGDRLGMKTSVEYSLAETTVDLVDWRRVPRA